MLLSLAFTVDISGATEDYIVYYYLRVVFKYSSRHAMQLFYL